MREPCPRSLVTWALVLGFGLGACDDARSPAATGEESPLRLEIVDGDAQAGPQGRLLMDCLLVRVVDAGGRPVEGVPVEWSVVSGGGKIGGKRHASDPAGLACGQFTLGPEPGENVARATVEGGASVTFTATGFPPGTGEPGLTRSAVPARGSRTR